MKKNNIIVAITTIVLLSFCLSAFAWAATIDIEIDLGGGFFGDEESPFGKVNTYDDNFSDVADSAWYAENVKTAYELGLMYGRESGKFDPDGNLTVGEGIAIASRLHSKYFGKELNEIPRKIIDFNTMDGIRLTHAIGDVDNGVLTIVPDAPNKYADFDLGVYIENLSLKSTDYTKMIVKMKRDEYSNINSTRFEIAEIYFATDVDSVIGANNKEFFVNLNSYDMDDWFEFEVDLTKNPNWKDTITLIRFDPTNNNGKYYIDSIVFSGDDIIENNSISYADYALKNGIIIETTFDSYTRKITRLELCALFARAIPSSHFTPINDIKGIPDVKKTDPYATEILMLYKAGILLGSDEKGTFNATSDVKRSEVAAIVNRVALPKNRVKGTIDAEWEEDVDEYYIVSYNANGGKGAPAYQVKTHDTNLVLSNVIPTRDGYKFKGWATSISGSAEYYSAGDLYTENSDVTFYAVWIEGKLPDDINGDGRISVRDASTILRYLAGYEVDADISKMDVNGDGKVSVRDASAILRYLAGYDVTLN